MSTTTIPLTTGTWTLDPVHSSVAFTIRHLGVTNVRGRFDRFDGRLEVGETVDAVHLEATVDLTSVNTNNADRDAHLLSTDFFDAAKHPTMTFSSTSISGSGDEYELSGDLTINGVTKPITFAVEFFGTEAHPYDGKPRAGFAATGEVRRGEYGIDFNMPLGMGKLGLGDKVKVELDAQFVLADAPAA